MKISHLTVNIIHYNLVKSYDITISIQSSREMNIFSAKKVHISLQNSSIIFTPNNLL